MCDQTSHGGHATFGLIRYSINVSHLDPGGSCDVPQRTQVWRTAFSHCDMSSSARSRESVG
jgi:hypothetical protein